MVPVLLLILLLLAYIAAVILYINYLYPKRKPSSPFTHSHSTCQTHPHTVDKMATQPDPRTFTPLGKRYGVDLHHAFYLGQFIPGADAGSFQVIDEHHDLAQDRYYLYCQDQPVEAFDHHLWGVENLTDAL